MLILMDCLHFYFLFSIFRFCFLIIASFFVFILIYFLKLVINFFPPHFLWQANESLFFHTKWRANEKILFCWRILEDFFWLHLWKLQKSQQKKPKGWEQCWLSWKMATFFLGMLIFYGLRADNRSEWDSWEHLQGTNCDQRASHR